MFSVLVVHECLSNTVSSFYIRFRNRRLVLVITFIILGLFFFSYSIYTRWRHLCSITHDCYVKRGWACELTNASSSAQHTQHLSIKISRKRLERYIYSSRENWTISADRNFNYKCHADHENTRPIFVSLNLLQAYVYFFADFKW